ncbi:MAG: FAD-binding oxidoreductase [Cyanobacteriota bacterium]
METADVVVIGGGNAGTSVLYYLAKKGLKNIILIEKELIASESTGKSAGGFRQQFSTEVNIKMSKFSVDTFRQLNEELDLETVFHHKGYTFLAGNEQQLKLHQRNVELQKSFGVDVDMITLDELKEIVPDIYTDDLVGATYCPSDGFTDPYEIAQGYVRKARQLGAKTKEKTEVIGINISNGKVVGVETDKFSISTPVVVNAAGPWSGEIGKLAGLELPIKPYRRQIFTSGPFKPFKEKNYVMPMVVDPTAVYMRSEGDRILMGFADKSEPPSFNQNLEWSFLDKLVGPAVNRIPIFEDLEIHDGWAGLYDTTPDHHAVLGRVSEVEGFILACGFSGHGFMHSPAVGTTIAELIIDGKPSTIDISPLSVDRFAGGKTGIEEVAVI